MTPNNDAPPWASIPATGPLLRPAAAAEYLGISHRHFYDQVAQGILPRPIKIGIRGSAVPQPWLDAYVAHLAEASL